QHRDARQRSREQLRLVAGARHRLEHAYAVADNEHALGGVAASVAARQNHRPLAAIAQQTRERRDNRRLAAAAHREIADADHVMMKATPPCRARIPGAPQPRDAAVGAAQQASTRWAAAGAGQWIMRNGRTTPSRSGGIRSRMTASVRSRAPRFDSTIPLAAAPTRARLTGSPTRLTMVSSSSL